MWLPCFHFLIILNRMAECHHFPSQFFFFPEENYISACVTNKFVSSLPCLLFHQNQHWKSGEHSPTYHTHLPWWSSLVPSPDSLVFSPILCHQGPLFPITYQLWLSHLQDFPSFIRVKKLCCYNIKTQHYSESKNN